MRGHIHPDVADAQVADKVKEKTAPENTLPS
jgi:hypothetical protein